MQLSESLEKPSEVTGKLQKRYDLQFKKHNNLTVDDYYSSWIEAFLNTLDPHSSYFSKSQLEEFHINSKLSLDGIGALLRSEDAQ